MPNLYDLYAQGSAQASTNGFANSLIAFAGQVVLYGVEVYNNSATPKYLMVFDSATVPADGTFPIAGAQLTKLIALAANTHTAVAVTGGGENYQKGIAIVVSTTPGSLTIDTAATTFIDAEYQSIP